MGVILTRDKSQTLINEIKIFIILCFIVNILVIRLYFITRWKMNFFNDYLLIYIKNKIVEN